MGSLSAWGWHGAEINTLGWPQSPLGAGQCRNWFWGNNSLVWGREWRGEPCSEQRVRWIPQPAPSVLLLLSLVFVGIPLVGTEWGPLSCLSLPRSTSSGWAVTATTPSPAAPLSACSPCACLLPRISLPTCSRCWRFCSHHSPDESWSTQSPAMPVCVPAAWDTQPSGQLQERAAPPEPGAVLDAPGGAWM